MTLPTQVQFRHDWKFKIDEKGRNTSRQFWIIYGIEKSIIEKDR